VPHLDAALAVQLNLRQLMREIVGGQLDTKRCGLLLYALQIASQNMRWVKAEFRHASENDMVRELPGPAAPPTSRKKTRRAAGAAPRKPTAVAELVSTLLNNSGGA
jgi:hypothetical protein